MDTDLKGIRHHWQIERRPFVTLNLDLQQMGVGGDNSWGARHHPEFRLPPGHYRFSFTIIPVTGL